MDERHVHKTRHATATAAPLTKRVGYFGQLSSAGFAPVGLSPRELAKENESMVYYSGPSASKTPLKKKTPSQEKLPKEPESPTPSPRSTRHSSLQDRRASSKVSSSVTPKPRKKSSRDSIRMEEDESQDQSDREIVEEDEIVEATSSNPHSLKSPSKMEEDVQDDLDAPKVPRKRSRGSMTPAEEGNKKKHSRRTIATKRSASVASMDADDLNQEEGEHTPKSTGKARSREKLSSTKEAKPRSRDSSRDSEQIPVRNIDLGTNEDDVSPSSRPPRKKPKIQESSSASSTSTFSSRSPTRAPSSPHLANSKPLQSPTGSPDQKKTPSLWNGFISRSIQKIKNLGSSSPKIPIFPSSETVTGSRDTSSEPTADMRTEEDGYIDSIGSPGYRATTSAPHAVGSPAKHRVPIYNTPQEAPLDYDAAEAMAGQSDTSVWRPTPTYADFRRGESMQDRTDQTSYGFSMPDDHIDARSASAGHFGTPAKSPFFRAPQAPATRSPTAYLASPQGLVTNDWSVRHARSPLRIPTIASPVASPNSAPAVSRPTNQTHQSHIIRHIPLSRPSQVPTAPFSPSSATGHVHFTTSPTQGRKGDGRHGLSPGGATKIKRTGGIVESIKRGLRNLMFGLTVVILLVLVGYLFKDILAKFFSSDPSTMAEYCAAQMKELLRKKRGDFICDSTLSYHISKGDMEKIYIPALCPSDKSMTADMVFTKLKEDPTRHYEEISNSWVYSGPDPIRPWACAIKQGFYNFLVENVLVLAGFIAAIGTIGVLIFRWRRSSQDKALARSIAERIIEHLKEEYAKDGNNGYLVKDYMEDDHCKASSASKRVWPMVVDLVESNIRVRTQPRLVHGDQLVTWVWSM